MCVIFTPYRLFSMNLFICTCTIPTVGGERAKWQVLLPVWVPSEIFLCLIVNALCCPIMWFLSCPTIYLFLANLCPSPGLAIIYNLKFPLKNFISNSITSSVATHVVTLSHIGNTKNRWPPLRRVWMEIYCLLFSPRVCAFGLWIDFIIWILKIKHLSDAVLPYFSFECSCTATSRVHTG